jgi:signal transduction histidine kinase
VINNNIGSDYDDLKIVDSAVFYYKRSLSELSKNKEGDPLLEILVHSQLAENLEKLNNFHEALEHKKIAFNLLQKLNDKSILNAFNLQKNYETIKEKEIKEKTLELKNKNAELKIFISTGLLIVLSLAFFFIYYSRKKLTKAYLQIQELQTSRENFYSIVAHDLRSHIDSYQDMAGMVSFLLKQEKYTQIQKIALQIDKTGLLLKNLLQNLFQWSLSQKEHLSFNAEPIQMSKCIENIIQIYSPMAEAKQIKIQSSIDEQQQVFTDPNYLTTVLRNIVDNAIKNSKQGTCINIQSKSSLNQISLSIQNQAQLTTEKFNIIKQLFSSTHDWQVGEKGIGLGLILIRDFTKKMGGTIRAELDENQITFTLCIPSYN